MKYLIETAVGKTVVSIYREASSFQELLSNLRKEDPCPKILKVFLVKSYHELVWES